MMNSPFRPIPVYLILLLGVMGCVFDAPKPPTSSALESGQVVGAIAAGLPVTSGGERGSSLSHNQVLKINQYMTSPNGKVRLVFHEDHNLVLYSEAGPVWESKSGGTSATQLIMQEDGNLVAYGPNIWAWTTATTGASVFKVQDDGNIVLYATNGSPIWARFGIYVSNPSGNVNPYSRGAFPVDNYTFTGAIKRLTNAAGWSISFGTSVPKEYLTSVDVYYTTITRSWSTGKDVEVPVKLKTIPLSGINTSGTTHILTSTDVLNLPTSYHGIGVWATYANPVKGTFNQTTTRVMAPIEELNRGPSGGMYMRQGDALLPNEELFRETSAGWFKLLMQGDGNLVLYKYTLSGAGYRGAVWNTRTAGNPGAYLLFQGDGNLVVYAPNGRPLWHVFAQGAIGTGIQLTLGLQGSLALRSGTGGIVWGVNCQAYNRGHCTQAL